MYFFGLEGSGFIISLGLILLMSGAIMFYCIGRFRALENSIISQGRILQTFIIRMQDKENSGSSAATNIAINSAINQSEIYEQQSKIEVSDDEEEEGDDDTDDDDDDDDDSDDDDSDHDTGLALDNIKDISLEHGSTISGLDLGASSIQEFDLATTSDVKVIAIEDLNPLQLDDLENMHNLSNDSSSDDDDDDDDDNNTSNNLLEISKLEPDKLNDETKKSSLSKMKVGYLRDLVLHDGLVDNMDIANKMKKDELLKILQA
jgi:hypothetical protein